MLDVVLVEPEIPPNAGNVIRLAANTGARLHLVEPLGFSMDDRSLKRAGLDYHELATLRLHRCWADCRDALAGRRMFALSTRGARAYTDVRYKEKDVLVFGAETRGLPAALLEEFPADMQLRLPMRPGNRSLNLSNAVAVVVFEAWRQLGFPGAG
ncbi:MAG TPA: tRNA (cytidine(34)-2'-O)-methyltransferase [Burkholderiales bacterium]|jgi:tRNA (cytidine/uridine-2'-O-)-methyltransferase|nr:tRNA (cytidine(34)-2'-O)-methyltransferase [Burkholderiales bacterium]